MFLLRIVNDRERERETKRKRMPIEFPSNSVKINCYCRVPGGGENYSVSIVPGALEQIAAEGDTYSTAHSSRSVQRGAKETKRVCDERIKGVARGSSKYYTREREPAASKVF